MKNLIACEKYVTSSCHHGIVCDDTAIRTARAHFLRESKIAEEKLKHCDKLPKPSKDSKVHAFNLKAYWESIGADIPALFVLYYVLSCCAASEATRLSRIALPKNKVLVLIQNGCNFRPLMNGL